MDDQEKLDLKDALKVIQDLLREQLRISGRLPETVVTVGGTALAALLIRERSSDVDLYMSEIDDTAIATVTKKYRARYGFGFKIDATPGNTLWGDFAINDIDQSPTVTTIQIDKYKVSIRALSPETLYLIKVAADRAKDRPDVPLIALKCSYDSLLQRALRLFPWYGDRSAFPEYVERLARAVARDFGRPTESVYADFKLSEVVLAKVREIRVALESQFWQVLKALMMAKSDFIFPDPTNPSKLKFDAKAANLPEEFLALVEKDPGRASDLAVSALKAADSKRYIAWLATLAAAARSRLKSDNDGGDGAGGGVSGGPS
jgi:hypothetical protein